MDKSTWSKDKEFVWGQNMLDNVFAIENRNEKYTLDFISAENGSKRTKIQNDEIGSALSLLAQLASCSWNCNQGKHIEEGLIRRFVNFCFSAMRLAKVGYYTEALSLIRSAGELGNLVELFVVNKSKYSRWCELNPKQRWREFSPYKVRDEISKTNFEPLMSKETYSRLSEIGIHTSPETVSLTHQNNGKKIVGAEFSVSAIMLIYNELTYLIGTFLKVAAIFRTSPNKNVRILNQAGNQLVALGTNWLRIVNYEDHIENHPLITFSNDLSKSACLIQALAEIPIFLIVYADSDLAKRTEDNDSFSLDLYLIKAEKEIIYLPIFSSEGKAKRFIGTLSFKEQKKVKNFRLVIDPILETDFSNIQVVLNYRTIHQRILSIEELKELKECCRNSNL